MTPQETLSYHARSFAPATRALSRADRGRIARLYALCRTLDDLADTVGGPDISARLTRLELDLRSAAGTDPLAIEARTLFSGKPLGLESFAALVKTLASDTAETCIATDAELDHYCMGVAGTVGIMVCALFEVDPQWHRRAADLGKAMQLTNICRDVMTDAQAGRRYLPYTMCPHEPDAIAGARQKAHADVRRAVGKLLARADQLYASGRMGLPALPLRLRLAVTAAAAMYAGIGDELRANSCNPARGRVFVPTWRKFLLVTGATASGLRPRVLAWKDRQHAET
ncbi:squalene/phytoene synthase family protein [Loktanella sp. SALINAS62]|uniref:phytoene/squalene synthase family protein n=1 Tax=Loktanella sp. SALINAS62 TaxID=2706124 RepID=UPI001B8AA9EA|nr:squalene/phytoene synthase family protein [Loktanella sp. SALINAS62]MBS1303387.1 squalene/phytoene synthase family protein [Loktanella sp. SALINAS62]